MQLEVIILHIILVYICFMMSVFLKNLGGKIIPVTFLIGDIDEIKGAKNTTIDAKITDGIVNHFEACILTVSENIVIATPHIICDKISPKIHANFYC